MEIHSHSHTFIPTPIPILTTSLVAVKGLISTQKVASGTSREMVSVSVFYRSSDVLSFKNKLTRAARL